MIPIRFVDLFHPCRAYDLLEWYWHHKRGTWERLVDTDTKRALELQWRYERGTRLNLKNPQTLNEKIEWLIAYTDTKKWARFVDKHEVREYVEECGFKDCLLKEYGVWDKVEEINFDALPDSFAIKCTHDSGSTILVKDKTKHFDKDAVVSYLRWRLSQPYGYGTVEPHYTKLQRRIVAEEMLPQVFEDNTSSPESAVVDYKFLCTDGKAQIVLLCYGRNIAQREHVREIYTIDPWESRKDYFLEEYRHQDFKPMPRPENLEQMVEMAERLSQGFPEVRVDLYNCNGKIYFGELTFAWLCGRIGSLTDEVQLMLGQKIKLPARNR